MVRLSLSLGFCLPVCLLLVSLYRSEAAFSFQRDDAFRVGSKKPGRVVLDPATGFYRPEKKVPAANTKTVKDDHVRPWDGFKSALYDTVDGIRTLPKKVKIHIKKEDSGTDAANTGTEDLLVGGYKDMAPVVTPGERLRRQRYVNIPKPIPNNELEEAEELPSATVFDSVKDVVYNTVDAAAAAAVATSTKETPKVPTTPATFKPVVRSSVAMSKDVRQALLDRGSEHPVKRAAAELKIREWEQKYEDLGRERNVKEHAALLKENIFKVGDAVEQSIDDWEGFVEALVALPDKISTFIQNMVKFFSSIPVHTQQAIDTVNVIPTRLQEKATEVEKSLQKGIETTNKFVQDVKDIPDNVQKTVEQTKKSLDATVESVNGLTTVSKVMLGIEKPAPSPPNMPPPEPVTPSTVGLKVAGTLVTSTAKAAWWVGKGVATFAFHGVKKVFPQAQDSSNDDENVDVDEKPLQSPQGQAMASVMAPPTKPTAVVPQVESKGVPAVESKGYTAFVAAAVAQAEAKPPVETNPTPVQAARSVLAQEATVVSKAAQAVAEAPVLVVVPPKPELSDLDRQVEEALKLAEDALK